MYIGPQPIPKASLTLTQGTLASNSQTITVAGGYTPGNIFVYINGYRLQTSEYTASDGSAIDLGEVFPAGTDYVVEEVRSFTLPDAYTKAEIGNNQVGQSGARLVGYDPTTSGLTTTQLQAAMDEAVNNQLGWNQTWQDTTASRSEGIIYTNTTGRPITLVIYASSNNSSASIAGVRVSVNGGALTAGNIIRGEYPEAWVGVIIPDGATYELTYLAFAKSFSWFELR